ncbi:aminotransferase class V-fold PLP-dependent enzyme [Collinsella sp. An2]|uniref:aminotransferase class V-fold PLP-dependent enzyme n=1 Tax=Collinsella sp. An2 TaxID=1965585 RepID=UPI000B373195|nr:aminotransferase class V-fold PLP-dependent enzyme [Collinsella sp. An2]OUP08714.1 cysteine desulfurase [Collinsella sp. An2]
MIYLNNAATTLQKPPEVAQAVLDAMANAGSSSRGASADDLAAARSVAGARLRVARLLGFEHPERVAFTLNATMALNTAIFGLLRPGDHVITTDFEHNSVLRPLNELERRGVIEVDHLPADSAGHLHTEDLDGMFRPNTRAIIATHASNLTGAVVDVAALARVAHAHGAVSVLDAAQSLGCIPVNMGAIGADIVCFTGHKALMGPQGTGGLAVSPGVELVPLVHGGTGVKSAEPLQPESYPEHLEAGTMNAQGLAGLAAALDVLLDLGVERVEEHERALRSRFVDRLGQIPGVEVYGIHDGHDHTGVVAMNLAGLDSSTLADRLAYDYGIATRAGLHCAPRMHAALGTLDRGAVRFSFGWYTTEHDVDAALDALCHIAREVG